MKKFAIIAGMMCVLMVVSGCGTYREHIAPKIPAIRISGEVSGGGVGAEVGFRSEWTDGERKRTVEVTPKVTNESD